eukprot:TRINITY_DN1964_c0_g2_i1.p1 TRINITY_DN1964_c0_g2~~TRINITY_DN1964_c0_g2_i1.p1  ORF type:complete len:292 (+),score=45.20 TRINITY_DN1964_c0_g2_i1:189-1064(+)
MLEQINENLRLAKEARKRAETKLNALDGDCKMVQKMKTSTTADLGKSQLLYSDDFLSLDVEISSKKKRLEILQAATEKRVRDLANLGMAQIEAKKELRTTKDKIRICKGELEFCLSSKKREQRSSKMSAKNLLSVQAEIFNATEKYNDFLEQLTDMDQKLMKKTRQLIRLEQDNQEAAESLTKTKMLRLSSDHDMRRSTFPDSLRLSLEGNDVQRNLAISMSVIDKQERKINLMRKGIVRYHAQLLQLSSKTVEQKEESERLEQEIKEKEMTVSELGAKVGVTALRYQRVS